MAKTFIIREQDEFDAGFLRCGGQAFDEARVIAGDYFFSYTAVNCDELTQEQVDVVLPILVAVHPKATFTVIEKAAQ